MREFALPSLGADMDEGMLADWLVEAGDTVTRGQVIAEVETDKGIIEVEIWEDAVIAELLVEPGETRLPVGTPIARLASASDPEVVEGFPDRPDRPPAATAAPVHESPVDADCAAHHTAGSTPCASARRRPGCRSGHGTARLGDQGRPPPGGSDHLERRTHARTYESHGTSPRRRAWHRSRDAPRHATRWTRRHCRSPAGKTSLRTRWGFEPSRGRHRQRCVVRSLDRWNDRSARYPTTTSPRPSTWRQRSPGWRR